MAKEAEIPEPAHSHPSTYEDIAELLREERYDRAAQRLTPQTASGGRREQAALLHILEAARSVILARDQSRAEIAWYRRLLAESEQRTQELTEQLDALLRLVADAPYPMAEVAVEDRSARSSLRNVWLRIKAWLVRRLKPQAPEATHPPPADVPISDAAAELPPSYRIVETSVSSPETGLPASPVAEPVAPGTVPRSKITKKPVESPPRGAPEKAERREDVKASPEQVPNASDVESAISHLLEGTSSVGADTGQSALREATEAGEPGKAAQPNQERPKVLVGLNQQRGPRDEHTFEVFCLGSFQLYQNRQQVIDWDSLKSRSIFKYLVTHRRTPTVKDVLMELFWPEADPKSARRNLHQAIYTLRKILRHRQSDFRHVQFKEDCYLLNPDLDIWVDCEEFERHVKAGERLTAQGRVEDAMVEYGAAEALYQGDFMEDELYEDWPQARRVRLRAMYLDIADRLSAFYIEQAQYTTAVALCQRMLARDDCCEIAHRRLMASYLAQGQRHLAVRQYQLCVQTLQDELDLSPSEETIAFYRRVIENG